MSEAPTARSLIDTAERAASDGDYAGAERLLRQAVAIQEAELGPLDPELANTLNNLGVVCEIVDRPADAERYYRRAHEIAAAVLAPEHPFVTTSKKNLDDFHSAQGRPSASQAAEPAAQVDDGTPAAAAIQAPTPPPLQAAPSVQRGNNRRRVAIAAFSVVVAIGVVMASVLWGGFGRRDEPATARPAPSRSESAAPPGERRAPGPAQEIATVAAKDAAVDTPAPPSNALAGAPSSSDPPIVTSAKLCRILSTSTSPGDWQCTAPASPVDAGLLSFYTRIRSSKDTTVQHRWYRGDRLYQSRDLRIAANSESGYRTFSQYRLDAESGGRWRVELRSADGILLHQEQFDVR